MDNEAPKFLLVNTADVGGGAEQICMNLINGFQELGYRSEIVVGYKRGKDPRVTEISPLDPWSFRERFWKGLSDTIRPIDPSKRDVFSRLRWRIAGWGELLAWSDRNRSKRQGREYFGGGGSRRLLEMTRKGCVLVHLHNLHGDYFDLKILPELSRQVPCALTLHDAWLSSGHCAHPLGCEKWESGCGECPDLEIYPPLKEDGTAANWIEKRRLFSKDRFVNGGLYVSSPGKWLLEKMQRSILATCVRSWRHIPNGVCRTTFRPQVKHLARHELGLPIEGKIVLFAATGVRHNKFKDVNTLRECLVNWGESESILCLAVGGEGEEERFAGATIRYIPFIPSREKMAVYYQAADVYVHAAIIETFPNTILEALACGTPVLASEVGGIPEQIKNLRRAGDWQRGETWEHDQATGLLIPPGKADLMRFSLKWLLDNPEVRSSMGKNGIDDVADRFDVKLQVKRTLEWYTEIREDFQNHRAQADLIPQ